MLTLLLLACQHDFDLSSKKAGSDFESPSDSGEAVALRAFVDVSVSYQQACVSRTGAPASCWGDGWGGQGVEQPPSVSLSLLATNDISGCGLDEQGQGTCWGSARVDGPPEGAFDAIAVGGDNGEACALAGTAATCWYANSNGTSYWEIDTIKAISLGSGNSCTIGLDDLPTCWGVNDAGQASPPAVPLRAVCAGQSGTACGVDFEGEAVCWGANRGGTADAPAGPFRVVEAGSDVTCGLHDDGTIECWGNEEKDLVHPPEGTFSDISVADVTACAISTGGDLSCWGEDWYGLVSQAPTE